MIKLLYYELSKIWHKKSFALSICVLVALNIFLLWYVNIPNNEEMSHFSYKTFQEEIKGMSEEEKGDYISKLNEMEGDNFVVNELYVEQQKVAGYNEYLQSVQKNQNTLKDISIFGNKKENRFSAKNVKKSAEDYSELSDENICWTPSKAISVAMENIWTDIFLILSVFLFVGNMIFEEKEKKLFYIIRSTKQGRSQSIFSKIIALFIHCVIVTFLLYGVNLIFAEVTVGFGDLTARIQSLSIYMESNLPISILEYIIYSVFTKGIVLFCMGTLLTALCIFADNIFLPYIVGFSIYSISYILYLLLPATEKKSLLKYINFVGLMKTENLYGDYLNFNIGGQPISRLNFSWFVISMFIVIGITASVFLFLYGNHFEVKRRKSKYKKHFSPHNSLLCYEGYKIMLANRAIIIIFLFAFLVGYRIISQEYSPSAQEQYYKDIMMQLEGELTDEKEKLILSERERYDEAFSEMKRIDNLVVSGEISENAGNSLKIKWQEITFFYPSFQRVSQQYQRICERGGNFIYDTGYLYLFGRMNDDYLIDLLLLSLCIVIAFSNVIAMEYQGGLWYLLSITQKGKKKIIFKKAAVCIVTVIILTVIPIICRYINVSQTYPLYRLDFAVTDIPSYQEIRLSVSILGFIILLFLLQMLSLIVITLIVLAISYWRKNHIQTVFFSMLILVVPLVLQLLGFSFVGGFSVYPLYSLIANI